MRSGQKGISPVVGTILLVAVTVIVAGVIAAFAMGLGTPTSAPVSQINFEDAIGGASKFYIWHNGGDSIPANELVLKVKTQNGESSAQEDWYNSSWQYRQKITVDSSKIGTELENFPVTVFLDSNNFDFSKAQETGSDIRFTENDGLTELDFERELHDSSSEKAVYHVRLPSISSSSDTNFYIYFGNSTAGNAESREDVWEDNYILIQHLGEDSGNCYDSTSYNNDGEPNGDVSQGVSGKVGEAAEFDGDGDYVEIENSNSLNVTGEQITLSAWAKWTVNPSSVSDYASIVSKDAPGFNTQYQIKHGPNNKHFELTVKPEWAYSTTSPEEGSWYHIAGTYDGSNLKIYVNGEFESSENRNGPLTYDPSENVFIGWECNKENKRFFKGLIDEVRISNVCKSDSWIEASYQSQTDNLLSHDNVESVALSGFREISISPNDLSGIDSNFDVGEKITLEIEISSGDKLMLIHAPSNTILVEKTVR